jgi:UDP-N-acetylmuramate dehydrogenase
MPLNQSVPKARENTMAKSFSHPCPHGDLLLDEPLAGYTSWRVGGKADRLFRPRDKNGLIAFLQEMPHTEPLFWLGMGSNLLVRDNGIRGTVISTRGRLNSMKMEDFNTVYAEAGALCPHVARFCSDRGLSGAEFLAGIPGTLGGALAMNAGAFGGETWLLVEQVLTVDRTGVCRVRHRNMFEVGYRTVAGPVDEFFLAARLKLRAGDEIESRRRIKALLAKRLETQPLNLPSCGSVFRNPPNDHAARLIEASGLKGCTIGGACVSEKHANFIVNRNQARAADIEALIELVRAEVERKQGVKLVPEVRIVGESKA